VTARPRVLFVGRSRLQLPLPEWLAKKWDAVAEHLDLRVLNAGTGGGDGRFRLLPPSAAGFYPRLPFAVARELRAFRPDVVVAADPYVGTAVLGARAAVRSSAKVIVEVHGDPRTFTRLYGSGARRAASPVADLVTRAALRRADATRALSAFTSSIVERIRGVPATATFPTYSDLSAFADPPLHPVPQERRLTFVGALEPYKNVNGLAEAWRRVARERPDAHLFVVGDGSRRSVVDTLLHDTGRVTYERALSPERVAARIDDARALVLPSWPEGLGRVVLEAFARGRTVVATDAGGIPDIVTDGRDGLLVPRGDADALVTALLRVLDDHELAVRLGAAARQTYAARWHQTPEDFARAYRELVDRVLDGAR
jgi:glycosyltransferase involved in cell wall biosynthesis